MNRNEEYKELLEKLDGVSVPEKTVAKAVRRKRIHSAVTKPLLSVAIFFLAFVLIVNVSPTVARALDSIPVIGNITRAVTFATRSVVDAVKNGYQQPLDMYDTDGEYSAKLNYLVADEKNVSFTFELTGDLPKQILPRCAYGSEEEFVTLYCEGNDDNTVLTAATTYVDQDIKYPNSGTLTIKLYDITLPDGAHYVFGPDGSLTIEYATPEDEEEAKNRSEVPFAEFSFDVTVDKSSIGKMKHYDVCSELDIEGQKICITAIDMYPTFTAVTIEADEANTARIRDLDFNLRDRESVV